MHSQAESLDPLPPKYSLRQRYPRQPPKDRSRLAPSTRQDLTEEPLSFNCMETAQRVLDFNRVTSVSLMQPSLSTVPSFDNPFSRTRAPRTQGDLAHSMTSSCHEQTPSNANSHKTTGSHKTAPTHQQTSEHRLLTEQSQLA
jgi:hypothetical protein